MTPSAPLFLWLQVQVLNRLLFLLILSKMCWVMPTFSQSSLIKGLFKFNSLFSSASFCGLKTHSKVSARVPLHLITPPTLTAACKSCNGFIYHRFSLPVGENQVLWKEEPRTELLRAEGRVSAGCSGGVTHIVYSSNSDTVTKVPLIEMVWEKEKQIRDKERRKDRWDEIKVRNWWEKGILTRNF